MKSGRGSIPIVRNRKTNYSIYLDPTAPESVRNAAKDLRNYFGKVTGALPEVISTEQPPSNPYISLGYTAAAREEGLDPSEIPIDGYRIVALDSNLFILGPDTPDGELNDKGGVNHGTSNGVYSFIEEYLEVRWLMPGEMGEEYTEMGDLVIPEMDREDHPPFDYRVISFRDKAPLEDEWDKRMKLHQVCPIEHNHSWIRTVPPSLYDEHPDWFAMRDGNRVPPIGRYYKLETTNQEMVQYFAEKIIKAFREDPKRRWYSLSPADGGAWSESPESGALKEIDPHGEISVTPLVLKFYNDVARIVEKEFPKHMLGGYLYANYRYPPSEEMDIESNLAFVIPNSPAYGFRLYRPSVKQRWDESIWGDWSELSRKHGFDIYYYDLPTTLVQPNGIICPPSPELLKSTFSNMSKYGFKGGYIYGNPVWPVSGPGNYTIARLLWNPDQDAREILHEYYLKAYGYEAGKSVERLFGLLDRAFSRFYNRNSGAKYLLTERHLEELYAPLYPEIESCYLDALSVEKKASQQKRLDIFGHVLSLLQWNLRDYGFLPPDYQSPLTLDEDEIDELLANQREGCRITRKIDFQPPELAVTESPPIGGETGPRDCLVPVGRGGIDLLLYSSSEGAVKIKIERFHRRAEFIQYVLTDEKGKSIDTGMVAEGRSITFQGKANKVYFLRAPYRMAALEKMRVNGAWMAFHVPPHGLDLDGRCLDEDLPLYFHVPEGTESFNLILGKSGAKADVFSPDEEHMGCLENPKVHGSSSHILISRGESKPGFWKILMHKSDNYEIITLDKGLPQWLITDPAHPLIIEDL